MLRYAKSLTLASAMGVSLLAMVGSARADIIPTLISITPEGSNFRWTYRANLTVDEKVKKNNFFTIYDFDGFIPGSNLQPAYWMFSSAMSGLTPSKVLPDDDLKLPNLTWKYTGNTPLGPGTLNLGLFSALSHYGNQTTDDFAAEATKWAPGPPPEAGHNKPIDNIGSVGVPTSAVPEPCSLALLGLGAAPILARRRRARSQA